MGDGSLSKEEIDALLMGADDGDLESSMMSSAPQTQVANFAPQLSPDALRSLADALNQSMLETSSAATTMASKEIRIENAFLQEVSAQDMAGQIQGDGVAVESALGQYATALVFSYDDAAEIVKSMMGSDMLPEKMDEASLSTIAELGNTIFSSLCKNLGARFGTSLTPATPTAKTVSSGGELTPFRSATVIKATYQLQIDGISSQLQQFLDSAAAINWLQQAKPTRPQMSINPQGAQPMANFNPNMQSSVNPVNYPNFQNTGGGYAASVNMPSNIDILMDVQMVLTVELGRTKKYVKDIFQLGEGSIIELDKLAGEPVDLLVNGKLIAKGEVVVIDENFGVRVTDIVGPSERLARMNEA